MKKNHFILIKTALVLGAGLIVSSFSHAEDALDKPPLSLPHLRGAQTNAEIRALFDHNLSFESLVANPNVPVAAFDYILEHNLLPKNSFGWDPCDWAFWYAAHHGNVVALGRVMAHNPIPDLDVLSQTFRDTVEQKHPEILKMILNNQLIPAPEDVDQMFRLSYANDHNGRDILKIMLEHKIRPDHVDQALQSLVVDDSGLSLFKTLLDLGSKLSQRAMSKAFTTAVEGKNTEFLRLILNPRYRLPELPELTVTEAFITCTAHQETDTLRTLLDHGLKLSQKAMSKAFTTAVEGKNTEFLRLILDPRYKLPKLFMSEVERMVSNLQDEDVLNALFTNNIIQQEEEESELSVTETLLCLIRHHNTHAMKILLDHGFKPHFVGFEHVFREIIQKKDNNALQLILDPQYQLPKPNQTLLDRAFKWVDPDDHAYDNIRQILNGYGLVFHETSKNKEL